MKTTASIKKNIIAAAATSVIILSSLPVSTSATYSTAYYDSRIVELCTTLYPEGKVQFEFDNGWTCHGYAREYVCELFGSESGNGNSSGWIRYNATSSCSYVDKICIGDLIRFKNTSKYDHTIVPTGFEGDTIIYTDCNADGRGTIRHNQRMSRDELDRKLKQILNDNGGVQRGYIAHFAASPYRAWTNSTASSAETTVDPTEQLLNTHTYSSSISKNQLLWDIFDAELYAACNPDVVRVYGRSKNSLYAHFQKYGIREGREFSIIYSPQFYLAMNKDVADCFGTTNYEAATNHFLEWGIHEKRESSHFYHGKFYQKKYKDLQNAFGNDMPRYALHFIEYTIKGASWRQSEWRQASERVDIAAYRARYSDLRKAYGTNSAHYFRHILLYGIKEGRILS